MATRKETVEFILQKLRHENRFTARAMFGEYALYADGKVVALVCDDRLYVKIVPASAELATQCGRRAAFQYGIAALHPVCDCGIDSGEKTKTSKASKRLTCMGRPALDHSMVFPLDGIRITWPRMNAFRFASH